MKRIGFVFVLLISQFSSYTQDYHVVDSIKQLLKQEQVKDNEALAEKYNSEGKFPYTVLLDPNGKVLKQWEGFPNETPEQFVDEIKSVENAGK
jgi:hypothetical protein